MLVLVPIAAGFIQSAVIIFVVTVVTLTVAFSVYTVMYPVQTAADRLENLTQAAESIGGPSVDLTGTRKDAPLWEQVATRLGQLAQAGADDYDEGTEEIKAMLKHAGYRNRRALDIFNGLRVAAVMLLPVVLSPLAFFMEISAAAFAMLLGAAAGYYLPKIILDNQASGRKGELLRSFPDALDLLVSCVESGLSLDQSFKRVAHEMRTVAPALAREFTLVNSEIGAGVDRIVSLKHLAERTGLEEVRSLVNMLAQSERFGSSVADSLRIYSGVAREKRMSRAEEIAGQAGSKLTIVMIAFFLPVLMMILLGPSMIRIFADD